MEQTAVEWLFDELIELNADIKYHIITWEDYLSKRADLLEQAKAMEKQQIIDAWDDAYDKGTRDRLEKISNPVGNAEQYFIKTFK